MTTLQALNERMQDGYKLSMQGDSAAACDAWFDVWRGIEREMDDRGLRYIDEFQTVFHGDQLVGNWAVSFEMELHNAAKEDASYAGLQVAFCEGYLAKMRNPDELNGLNLRRAIAEARFTLGDSEEGAAVYRRLTEDHPAWAWGWISWAEQYGSYGQPRDRDPLRGAELLRRALAVEALEDRTAVLERLQDLYMEAGMTAEAEAVRIPPRKGDPAPGEGRIGRNDPCPCGSGKKYKKCCGAPSGQGEQE